MSLDNIRTELYNILYKEDLPTGSDFFHLFETTGWNSCDNRTKEELYSAIKNSWYSISAYSGTELIGFGRIISDGVLHAFIVDLIILAQYQGHKIGKSLLKKMVDKLISNGINDIQLFCAKGKKDFYLKNGFEERNNDAPGMQYKV